MEKSWQKTLNFENKTLNSTWTYALIYTGPLSDNNTLIESDFEKKTIFAELTMSVNND